MQWSAKTRVTRGVKAECEKGPLLFFALLLLCGNQNWMFCRMKNKPLLPAHFHEVSCLFKGLVWDDVGDEGQMWIAKAHIFLSSEKLWVIGFFYNLICFFFFLMKYNWCHTSAFDNQSFWYQFLIPFSVRECAKPQLKLSNPGSHTEGKRQFLCCCFFLRNLLL